jgi:hypothetical protein
VHAPADLHDTPDSSLLDAPDGFGVDCSFHVVPFQTSAKVDEPAESV